MDVEIRTTDPQPVVYRQATTPLAELGAELGRIVQLVHAEVRGLGAASGAPFVRYQEMGDPATIEVGIPVVEPLAVTEPTVNGELPGGRHAVCAHVGSYDRLAEAWATLAEWLAKTGERPAGPAWESYLTDPALEPDPALWITEIVLPLA